MYTNIIALLHNILQYIAIILLETLVLKSVYTTIVRRQDVISDNNSDHRSRETIG